MKKLHMFDREMVTSDNVFTKCGKRVSDYYVTIDKSQVTCKKCITIIKNK